VGGEHVIILNRDKIIYNKSINKKLIHMNNRIKIQNKGFTLLEILLTITLIGILATIALIAINPNRQLGQSRDLNRQKDISDIQQAVELYAVRNSGAYPAGIPIGSYKDICPEGEVTEECVDLSLLVPTYLTSIPTDPTGVTYKVGINPDNNTISVFSELSENADIAVNKFTVPIGGQIYSFANKYNNGYGSAITYLSDGSSVITGGFNETATFGEAPGTVQSLTSTGSNDIFIAKYNPNGSLAWAKKAGGTSFEYGYGITSLSDGSSVVTGIFNGTATFGEAPGTVVNLTSTGRNDIFIAKYNPNGSLAWAKKAGGTSFEYGYGITSLSDGSTVITGEFEGTATFGEAPGTVQSLTSTGRNDIFIAKYNPNGSLAWAKKAGGTSFEYGYGITSLSDGSTVITGGFNETATFGEAPGTVVNLTSAGSYDIFIAKYNPNGSLAWAKKAGGTSFEYGSGITSLSDGSTVITGGFNGTATFGEAPGTVVNLTSAGSYDIFIAKYNPDGSLAWAKRAGGENYEVAYGIAIREDEQSFGIVGYTDGGLVTFGPGDPGEIVLDYGTDWGGFITQYPIDGVLE
jgi:prepilin-type N-terminal cleavage/methylation domain-containing protein/uncharacterized delta-60 repeat protein